MKVILESEFELWAWKQMMAAHNKWEKNHGNSLSNHMRWWFGDLYSDETNAAIQAEIDRRLKEEFDADLTATEEEYIQGSMVGYEGHELQKEYEAECRREYQDLQSDIARRRESMPAEIEIELYDEILFRFFNSPEDLTVIFDGEVIQGK